MHENELQEIWKSEQTAPLPTVNSGDVKLKSEELARRFSRKIIIEVVAGIPIMPLLIAALCYFPGGVYFLPLVFILSIWYSVETYKLYKSSKQTNNVDLKSFLQNRERSIRGYMTRGRIGIYSMMPFLVVSSTLVGARYRGLTPTLQDLTILVIGFEILIIILMELYLRNYYRKDLTGIRRLLHDLDSE